MVGCFACVPPPAKADASQEKFSRGTIVHIHGLCNNAELNGKQGTIAGYDTNSRRFLVEMKENVGVSMSMGPQNLIPEQGGVVRISGLVSNPEMNGKRGRAMDFDSDLKCWRVQIEGGNETFVKADNLVLDGAATRFSTGAAVRVGGLSENTEFNGRRGIITGGDAGAEFWHVRLECKVIRLSADNLKLLPAVGSVVRIEKDIQGTITGWNPNSERWTVHVENDDVCVKAQNLMPESDVDGGLPVRIAGLVTNKEFNGKPGVITGFDRSNGCWRVQLQGGQETLLKPENVVLDASQAANLFRSGSAVRIGGLESNTNFNGKRGIVTGFDANTESWSVRPEGGKVAYLKSDQLQC